MQSALLHLFGSYYAWFHFYPDNEAMQSGLAALWDVEQEAISVTRCEDKKNVTTISHQDKSIKGQMTRQK